jgi:hypothetical protein
MQKTSLWPTDQFMPHRFGRPQAGNRILPSFLDEAGRLRAFVPPFKFSAFFSPEDTLLCACVSEAALVHARSQRKSNAWSRNTMRIAELTTGSGLVGLHLLMRESGSRLVGLDVDPSAVEVADKNARLLGLARKARFECADLWSDMTISALRDYSPDLVICNPPYVPERDEEKLMIEAGAGPDGTAHLMRAIELTAELRPKAMSLSWCSLSDPAKVLTAAARAGFSLNSLYIVAIADGEYSGTVHDYLRSLPHAYINEQDETVSAVAPDGSGRFSYLLMAGAFSRTENSDPGIPRAVEAICARFEREGLPALSNINAPIPVRSWILDRWDELRMRAFLHGAKRSNGISA